MVFMAFVAASCARAPVDQYSAVMRGTTAIATSNAEAIRLAEPRRLLLDEPVEAEIDVDDPRIKTGDTLANYELFVFEVGEDLSFVLDVKSFQVSAWGARVLLLAPTAYVMDSAGTIVDAKVTRAPGLQTSFWRGTYIYGRWRGHVPKPGTYYFLVRAYNEKVGWLSKDTVPTGLGGIEARLGLSPTDGLPVINYPTGAIQVQLRSSVD